MRRHPRILAGVCQALATHLGGNVAAWRAGFLLACMFYGLGAGVYIILVLAVPHADPTEHVAPRLAPKLAAPTPVRSYTPPSRKSLLFASLLILTIAAVIALMAGSDSAASTSVVFPVLIFFVGAATAWAQPGDGVAVSWTVIGASLATLGSVMMIAQILGWQATLAGVGVGLVMLTAVSVVLAGVFLRNKNQLFVEQARRIRESERANIAAHLHDSVLQTLTLIRARADDPIEVATLARTQEHDLRRYLYSDRGAHGTSLAEEIRTLSNTIEATFHVEIDVVISGDSPPTRTTQALVGATREALTNAAKHGSPKISLFADLSTDLCEVFVRDRGTGFTLESIPSDRAGIRDSIYARLQGAGGEAEIRSPLPSGGTEVRMRINAGGKK